jgi:nitroimidazol reductase NimA-like FMN-containing flavoprotein (pyridoxamine 5'-phosphate oxidase superfamily)
LLFHGAVVGHRLEALRANPRVCFTAIEGPEESADAIPAGSLGTYSSVLVFGEMEELPPERRAEALVALCRRYAPDRVGDAERFIREGGAVSILRMSVAHISGKRLLVR